MRICDAVKAAAAGQSEAACRDAQGSAPARLPQSSAPMSCCRRPIIGQAMARTTETVVCIGASTGGTESLRVVLEALPVDCPGIVIVQHMPEKFTAAFARRLDGLCEIEVKEAADGDAVLRGRALIAPGQPAYAAAAQRRAVLCRGQGRAAGVPPPALGRRAVPLGRAKCAGSQCDGHHHDRHGRRRRARAAGNAATPGASTVAQDEATSVVFGMPKEAIERGAAGKVVPLGSIAAQIVQARR